VASDDPDNLEPAPSPLVVSDWLEGALAAENRADRHHQDPEVGAEGEILDVGALDG
jgi:hypothetical protein